MRFPLLKTLGRYWLPVSALIFFVIAVLSLSPLPSLPSVPGTDKTHHFAAYALLALPVAISRPQHWRKILILFIACSGIIELLQPLTNRYCELLDLVANGAGVFCGATIAWLIRLMNQESE